MDTVLYRLRRPLGLERHKHTNLILSGQPFFSYLLGLITERVCFFARIVFPVMSHNFILSKVAFYGFFPLEYPGYG